MLRRLVDPWLYRHPFVGASARRYARDERPAFGDLDARLCDRWAPELAAARRVVDVGAGPGTFVATVRARFPHLDVIAIEPSQDFPGVRARAESLPLADGSIDVGVMLSSIRHVEDRLRALRELRRVIRAGGVAWIVELDPEASRTRVRAHARGLASSLLRVAFGPLVVSTAPTARTIERVAREAGWRDVVTEDDPVQPVYLMRLS